MKKNKVCIKNVFKINKREKVKNKIYKWSCAVDTHVEQVNKSVLLNRITK